MVNKSFFVDGGNVQVQPGAIYLRRFADEQLLALCRTGTFAYVLTARQMGKSSLMINTEEHLAEEGIRTVEIDLNGIGVKVTRDEWYRGILFEIQSQLSLTQDVTEWWNAPIRSGLSATQRLLLFFEEVMLVEISEPIIIFVDEIETTIRLDFTDDFFAAVRRVHNARSSRRFQRLAFVLIGAATPDSLIRDQKLTPFNIGQGVVLSDFTFEEAVPLAVGFGLPPEQAQRVLRRVLHWSGGHPYLTQRICRAIAETQRDNWTDAYVDKIVERVFFDDQSDIDKNLRFVREMLLTSDLSREYVLKTYRDILNEGRPVLDDEQALIKSHLKLSGIVKRQGMALRVRNPVYRRVFNESFVKTNMPINWTRRLTRVAVAALVIATLLGPYAWIQKTVAEAALANEKSLNHRLEQSSKNLEEKNKELELTQAQLRAAKEEAEQQGRNAQAAAATATKAKHEEERLRRLAQVAAQAERHAKEIAEVERGKAERLAQNEKTAKDEAEKQRDIEKVKADKASLVSDAMRRRSFIDKLLALDRGTESLPDRVIIAREALLQAKQAGETTNDFPAMPSAYENLMANAMLLPRSTAVSFDGKITSPMFTRDGQTLVGIGSDEKTLQLWDLKNQKLETRKVSESGSIIDYSLNGRFVAIRQPNLEIRIHDLQSDREFVVFRPQGKGSTAPVDTNSYVIFSPDEKYVLNCPCDHDSPSLGLWHIRNGQKIADLPRPKNMLHVDFSGDGRFVNMIDRSGQIYVFETEFGRAIRDKPPEKATREKRKAVIEPERFAPDELVSTVYSANKNFLLIASQKVAEVWNLSNPLAREKVARIDIGTGRLSKIRGGLAVSDDGQFATTFGESNATVDLWDLTKKDVVRRVNNVGEINVTLFSPDGKEFLTISDAAFRVWDTWTGVEVYRGVEEIDCGCTSGSFGPAISPDGNSLVTSTKEGLARLWDISTGAQSIRRLINFSTSTLDLSNDRFVTINPDSRTVDVRELSSNRLIERRTFDQKLTAAIFSADGNDVVLFRSGGNAYAASIWRWKVGARDDPWSVTITTPRVSDLALSRGGKFLAAVVDEDNPAIRIWGVKKIGDGKLDYRTLSVKHVQSASFIPNSDHLVVRNNEGTQLWDVLNDRPVGEMIGRSSTAAPKTFSYSEDGTYIAAYSDSTKQVEIAETATGTIVGRLPHPKGVKALDIDRDGDVLATAGEDNVMRVWVWKGQQPRIISQATNGADRISISREGQDVASVFGKNPVRVWDISKPGVINEAARLQPGEGAEFVFFSSDLKYLYTLKDSLLQSWQWEPNYLMCEATSRLIKKDLGPEEWEKKADKLSSAEREAFLTSPKRPVVNCENARPAVRQ
jgi:WD40 repeat protein